MLGKTGSFTKVMFLFLRGHTDSKCKVIITGKRVNLVDYKGMHELVGHSDFEQKKKIIPNCMNFRLHFEKKPKRYKLGIFCIYCMYLLPNYWLEIDRFSN